ncbi:hypothetical protein MACK_001128 [Theileria orientalis]|uniref:Uncharacterized protein n=1 Tax=Theileria orientalis TaxID=68886 RepID=A0A976MCE3_THEOR|nr:hypothetical protein MACK_001128 [Theileria orientalis]
MSKIVVYYQQHWLPDFEGLEATNLFNVKSCREIEVILEPQILTICLLRKVYPLKMAFKPCLYDSFYDGVLPASIAANTINMASSSNSPSTTTTSIPSTSFSSGMVSGTNSGFSSLIDTTNSVNFGTIYDSTVSYTNGIVLRNEQLIRYLVTLVNLGVKLNSTQLQSDFFHHYPITNRSNNTENTSHTATTNATVNTSTVADTNTIVTTGTIITNTYGGSTSSNNPIASNPPNSTSSSSRGSNSSSSSNLISGDRYSKILLVSYIYSHLRHCVLYLIWLHPIISTFTFSVTVNSEPVPFAYYSFLRKRSQVRQECNQLGYSSIDKVLRDLRFILEGVRVAISQKYYEGHTLNDVCWFEGYVFSNVSVLFSLPCKDFDDLLCLHRDFDDLKMYCININSRYDVVSLKPPFLCGDTMSTTEFKATLIWYLFKIL